MQFQHRLVTIDVEDRVAIVRIRRERANHTLNPATAYQLSEAIEAARRRHDAHGIVITGSGATFSNGADLNYFVSAIEQKRIDRILEFTQAGNECYDAIEHCPKPVVAALNGSALGGGLELALACGRRIAARAASFAFPETGFGLFPGWGGVARLHRLLPAGLAKWLVYSGRLLSAGEAHAIGLVDQLTTPPRLLEEAKLMALHPRRQSPAVSSKPEFDSSSLAEFCRTYSVDEILAGRIPENLTPDLAAFATALSRKDRSALRLAEELFSRVETLTRSELSSVNLQLVARAFQSEEVHRRLTSTPATSKARAARRAPTSASAFQA